MGSSVTGFVMAAVDTGRTPRKRGEPAFEPIRQGESEDSVIGRFYPILCKIAARMAGRLKSEFDDCLSDGHLGILKAVRAYDPSRGAAFHTHATNMAIWEMIRGRHRRDPISAHGRKRLKLGRALEDSLGVMLTDDEIEAEIPGYKAAAAAAHLADNVRSWDAMASTDTLAYLGCDGGQEREAEHRELAEHLQFHLDRLPKVQRDAITLRYLEALPLKTVCDRLGHHRSTAQQIIAQGLAAIREAMTAQATSGTPAAQASAPRPRRAAVRPAPPAPAAEAPSPTSPDGRPLNWVSATRAVLLAGPADGMAVADIMAGVAALGVRATGPKVSLNPVLMADDALYRLREKGEAERTGTRFWRLVRRDG